LTKRLFEGEYRDLKGNIAILEMEEFPVLRVVSMEPVLLIFPGFRFLRWEFPTVFKRQAKSCIVGWTIPPILVEETLLGGIGAKMFLVSSQTKRFSLFGRDNFRTTRRIDSFGMP